MFRRAKPQEVLNVPFVDPSDNIEHVRAQINLQFHEGQARRYIDAYGYNIN